MKKRMKQTLSILLAVCMTVMMLPTGAFALEAAPVADSGLCAHHTEHTAECGYVAAVEGSPCTHVHDETCGYAAAVAEIPCNMDCTDTDGDGIIDHAEGCAYAPAVGEQPCTHVHDESCGYVEAVEGAPCTFVCTECAKEIKPTNGDAATLNEAQQAFVDAVAALDKDTLTALAEAYKADPTEGGDAETAFYAAYDKVESVDGSAAELYAALTPDEQTEETVAAGKATLDGIISAVNAALMVETPAADVPALYTAGNGLALQLGTSGVADKDFIYFGNYNSENIKWKVLDADADNTGKANGMFLLSEYLLEQSNVPFDADKIRNEGQYDPNKWQHSDAQAWCTAFAASSAFTTSEKTALKTVSKEDSATTKYGIAYGTSSLVDEKVFYLSAEEAATYISSNNFDKGLAAGSSGGIEGAWWLRSPNPNYTVMVGFVNEDGFVNSTDVAYTKVGVRPAFNLDTSKVLFSSAATDGKASGTVGAGALNSVPEYTDTTKDWKVTLLDTSRQGFTAQAAESAATSKDVGYESWSVDIAYSNANKGTNEYVSAMLCDADGNVFYYGNIAQNSASGTQTVNIPTGLGIGNYTLKVFSEQLTGDNKPDYASTMQDIALTVTGSVIEPVTPVPVIQFGTSDVADKGFVYFGKYNSTDIKWKVLDADKTNTNEDGMFLLSEYLLEQSNVPFDADNNVWQGSDAQAWCTSFATSNAFTDAEKIALKGVAKTDVATNKYSLDWGTSELTAADDKVFYLSAEEAANYIGPNNSDEGLATTTSGGAAGYWWLRSPDYSNPDTRTLLAGFVNEDGCVLLTSVDFTDPGVRPAFNLDTSKILFTSLTGGKSATGMDTALTAVPIATPSEWTLTLSDSARSTFTAETTGKIGDVLTVSYTGATTGDNEYISAVVKAADGAIKYYGRVAAVSNAEGSATINLSGITMADSDTLCVFNEQYNGDNKTDYASELRAVSLTAPPVPVIQLGTSGVVDKNFVYFGKYNSTDIKWKVLDADKTNTNEDGMFLLSEYLLEQSNVSFDADSNVWQGSDAQAWCTAFAGSDAFTTSEKSALKSVSKNDAQTWQYNWNWGTSSLSNEKVFYLSAEEAATYIGSNNGAKGLATTTSGGTAGYWWLRSPYYNYTYLAGCVVEDGDVDRNGVDDSYTDVRPAFNLDISKVLFTSLTGGKSTTGMDTALTAVPIATPSEWTLTLSDSARSAFTAETTEKAGDVLTVSYTGATTGDNEYISAVVKAADGAIKYYGRVAQVTNAEGNANINLSGITMADGDTLCVFNEQYNGDNKTDYASELKDVSLTVIPLPDLTVTGGTKDTDYTYADGVLTVLTSVPLTIANRNVNIATTDRIVVANGKTANLTLNGVTIETLGNAAAITVKNAADTKLNLTLAMGSTNTLKGADNYAGIDVTGDAALTIDGTGTLDVTGGAYSAGIGGGSGAGSNGIITINSGTVIASGGEFGSGIGNGTGGGAGIDTAKTITINGGTVTANGIYSGAGIGCGGSGSNGTIIINSGIVTANGGITGVDIGSTGGDSTITITGGSFAVGDTTANTVYGNAVASGYCVKNIGGSCPYTVVKLADVTITPTTDENKLSQTYAETTFDATKLFTFDENCGTATYSLASGGTGEGSITKEGVLTVTKAGTFKIQVDTAAHDGYAAGSESVTLTVKKAANSCTGPVIMNDYTYGGAVSGPAIIEYEGPATYYYNTSDDNTGGTEWKGITPTTLNANDYWIYATVAGDDLHNDFISSAKKFTVRRATPTVELTAKETGYTGSPIPANTATVTLVGSETYAGTITYKYYTDIDCTKGETETAPTTAGTYYVKASIAAAGNYTSAVSAAVKLEITQATAGDVTTPTTTPVTYSADGKLSNT
ncbi:MAG: DUF6273 domain-containing protein [Oscillospiraceae bacterium]|nr:DUF6273 domain-containing protein [Oscillospiraceae bacterium]